MNEKDLDDTDIGIPEEILPNYEIVSSIIIYYPKSLKKNTRHNIGLFSLRGTSPREPRSGLCPATPKRLRPGPTGPPPLDPLQV